MPDQTKDQRKALKTTITNAISAALSKNKHLKDKKVQKAIEKAGAEIAKKITKADKVKATPATKKPVKPVTKKAASKSGSTKTKKISSAKPASK